MQHLYITAQIEVQPSGGFLDVSRMMLP